MSVIIDSSSPEKMMQKKQISIAKKRFLLLMGPIVMVILLAILSYDYFYFQAKKAEIFTREKEFVTQQKKQLTNIYSFIAADLNLLASFPEIKEILTEKNSPALDILTQKFLTFLTFKRHYDQFRLLDCQGREKIRIDRDAYTVKIVPQKQLQDKSSRYYFKESIGLSPGDIYVSLFDLNIEKGVIEQPIKPVIRFVFPIFADNNHKKGLLVLNYLGEHFLSEMERTNIRFQHGQLALLNSDGYWLKGFNPGDEWGFMLPDRSDKNFKIQYPEIWKKIVSPSGQIETDSGIFSYVTVNPIRDDAMLASTAHWIQKKGKFKLISFVSRDKIMEEMYSLRLKLILFTGGIIALISIGLWFFVRVQTGYTSSQKHLRDAEQMIRQLRESLNNGFVRYTPEGQVIEFNETYRKMMGFEEDELKGKFLSELTSEESQSSEDRIFKQDLLPQGQSKIYEKQGIRKDGSRFPLEKQSFTCLNDQGEIESIWAIISDISQRKEYEQKLRLLASVFENTVEGIIITNIEGTIEEVNPGFSAITGYSPEEVIGKNPRMLKSNHHDADFYKNMWQSLKTKGFWTGEIWNRRKNGEVYPERLSINAVVDYNGEFSHYISVFYDISDIKRGEQQLQHQAHHDALTGLPNRLLFFDRLKHSLIQARRNKNQVAVLFLDIDNFKTINDSLGHNVGDIFLQQFSKILRETLREEDTVARFGGDEFILLLEACTSRWDACEVAKRIFDTFKTPIPLKEGELFANFSMGISLFPEDGSDAETLIKNSDLAMYKAKALGKNSYHLYTESMNKDARRRLELENNMRRALEREEFEVFYQPKVDIVSGQMTGCEALVRWWNKDTLISPLEFIPLAEETGLIIPIGEWILRSACQNAQFWYSHGYAMKIAVNLSPRQFHQENLVSMVCSVLEDTKLPASLLELEITEGIVMDDVQEAINTLHILRKHGINFAIDDFGTGYSSLQYLRQLPLDTLKIDRAFIKHLPENKEDVAITKATLSMAHSLGLKVVAEGVETEAQLDFLRRYSCQQLQGYIFSKPVQAETFFRFLQEGKCLAPHGS